MCTTRMANYRVLGLPEEVVLKDHYWVRTRDGLAGNAIDFLVNSVFMFSGTSMPLRWHCCLWGYTTSEKRRRSLNKLPLHTIEPVIPGS